MNQEGFAFRGDGASAELRPSFLCIGQPHSATTWLSGVLSFHPQVGIPRKLRAVDFFSFNHHMGERWYLRQFDYDENSARILGDVEPLCVYNDLAPARIAAFGSIDRIIVMLRDPLSWMTSSYHAINKYSRFSRDRTLFLKFHGREFELLRMHDYVRNYFQFFDRHQFLFVTREDLEDIHAVKDRLAEFLDVDADGFHNEPPCATFNRAREPRSRLLYGIARDFRDQIFPRFEWSTFVENRVPTLRGILFREPGPPPAWLFEELRARRFQINEQTERLGAAIDRDLSDWLID